MKEYFSTGVISGTARVRTSDHYTDIMETWEASHWWLRSYDAPEGEPWTELVLLKREEYPSGESRRLTAHVRTWAHQYEGFLRNLERFDTLGSLDEPLEEVSTLELEVVTVTNENYRTSRSVTHDGKDVNRLLYRGGYAEITLENERNPRKFHPWDYRFSMSVDISEILPDVIEVYKELGVSV